MDHHHHGVQPQGATGENYYAPHEKSTGFVDQQQHPAIYQDPQYQAQQYHNANGVAANHYQSGNPGYTAPVAKGSSPTIMGMKKAAFIGLLAALILLLALVIGLGAGLGVSQSKLHDAQADLANAQASATSAASAMTTVYVTTTTKPSTSATKTSSSATASATADKFSTCPGANNTVYTSSEGSRKFTVHCGLDYSGAGEADDLDSTKTTTMSGCMDACADNEKCQGAGWGFIDGDTGNNHSCYMKTNLTKFHIADSNWLFAVLNTNTTSS
ncbi:hypothetical protein BJ170DRAFT_159350 [Xylariales sp. AK1849]|nr:hypothetical protein BJ170DRAFT_159350 [Xylariales sp. AK1849]